MGLESLPEALQDLLVEFPRHGWSRFGSAGGNPSATGSAISIARSWSPAKR
jgi:hypothetical protein